MFNHRVCSGYPERTARTLQLREAPYARSDRCTVGVRHARHVKNHPRLLSRNHAIHFSLQPGTFRPAVYAAFYLEHGHIWLQNSFCEVCHRDAPLSSPSYGNCRINRTQSPSAEKIDVPQPHGTNEAVFWFTALSASA